MKNENENIILQVRGQEGEVERPRHWNIPIYFKRRPKCTTRKLAKTGPETA